MIRTKVYVDGFNLYHAIDKLNENQLKWLNLWSLSEAILRDERKLVGVEYFSAIKDTNKDRTKRHESYITALEHFGVNVHLGKFKKKHLTCRNCKERYTAWEEKETDVHIAVTIVEDAFTDQFDNALVISADTDLMPPANSVRHFHPEKTIAFVAPPKRMAQCRALEPIFEITVGQLRKNLLPEQAINADGETIFVRPKTYAPTQHLGH